MKQKIKIGEYGKYKKNEILNGAWGKVIEITEDGIVLEGINCNISTKYHLTISDVYKMTEDEILVHLI